MKRLATACCIFALAATACLAATKTGQAQVTQFDFVQDGTGVVLATLDVFSLPVNDLSDFGTVSFTPAGDSVFGFGVGVYPSSFSFSNAGLESRTADVVNGELVTTNDGDITNQFVNIIDQGSEVARSRFHNETITFNINIRTEDSLTLSSILASGVVGINNEDTLNLTAEGMFVLAISAPLLRDVSGDGFVNFLDIAPFISILSAGVDQDEADINEDGEVDFLDISPFIAILSGQ